VLAVSPTARDLLLKITKATGMEYRDVAKRVNASMAKGDGFIESVHTLAAESGLNPDDFKLDPLQIVREIRAILKQDYTQTLMISAVLGQLVESKDKERFPPPAFFVYLEILSGINEAPRSLEHEPPQNVDESTTRIIELTTTLVSLICDWNETGVVGIAKNCPESLRDTARSVFRRTKLLQSGMWACVSCGRIVDVATTHALLCSECNSEISSSGSEDLDDSIAGGERTSYGRRQ
jgi:hypothetical protein